MSTSGLTSEYNPPTLDGLTVIDADEVYIDGQKVDLSLYVPYVGADKTIDVGSQCIQTSYTAVLPQDVVNFQVLTDAIDGQDIYNADQFLDKLTTTAQTVAGAVTFQNDVNMTSQVVTGTNYQSVMDSATVTVSQYFGSITNVGSVYQATTQTGGDAVLSLFSITAGQRASFTISFRIYDPVEAWFVEIYQSADNITPVGVIPIVELFPIADNSFHILGQAFTASTTGFICARISSGTPSATVAVEWKDMATFGMGVSLTNATYPSLTADRVAVLNERKQLVSSGISVTKLGYLDNVSSDIQTQINGKVSKAGDVMTGALDMGPNKVTTTYVPVNGPDLINKTYGDATYATPSALAGYALLAGANTFTGSFNRFQDGTQTTTGILSLKNNTNANADVGFELNASNQSSTAKRLGRISFLRNTSGTSDYSSKMGLDVSTDGAIYKRMITLHPTDGVSTETNSLTIGGALTQLLGNTADFANALKVNQTVLGFTQASFLSTGMPLGINGGTITGPTTGVYRLTAVAGTAATAMRLSGFTPAQGGVYTYQFTGMRGSVTLVQKVIKDLITSVISTEPTSNSVTTTPGVIQGFFTIPNPVTSAVCFLFEATSIDPWVEWSSFVLRRGDTEVTGVLTCDDAVSVAGSVGIGTTTPTKAVQIYVAGGANEYRISSTAMDVGMGISGGNDFGFFYNRQNFPLVFGTNNVDRMRILGNGFVAVGYTISNNFNGANCKFTINADYTGGDTGAFCINATDNGITPNAYNLRLFPYVQAGGQVAYQFKTYNTAVGYNAFKILHNGNTQFDNYVTVVNGDNSKTLYGPNATWSAFLEVGSGTNAITANKAQIISTNGNLHLDAATGKDMYYGFYANLAGGPNNHYFSGRATLTSSGTGYTHTYGTVTLSTFIGGGGGWIGTDTNHTFSLYTNNSSPRFQVNTNGACNVIGGTQYAVPNGFMTAGSLTIGATNANYGGGYGWTSNTAGLMFECETQTEIAVHDAGNRVASLMYFVGDAANVISIGRDMGWGTTSVLMPASVSVGGQFQVGTGSAQMKMALKGGSISGDIYTTGNWPSDHNALLISQDTTQGPNTSGMCLGYGTLNSQTGVITCLGPGVAWRNLYISAGTTYVLNSGSTVAYTNGGGWVNISDEREKEDIQDIKTSSSLKRVLALRPKHYRRKFYETGTPVPEEVKQQRVIGFSAQEVQQSNPHCVSGWENDKVKCEEDDGKRMGICYNDYVIHLVGAVQEVVKQIDEQKKRVEVLEAREVMWESHARQQEATIKDQEERLGKAEAGLEKVAGLLAQIISKVSL